MLKDDIRKARERAGLSQLKLAQLAGVPRSQLRKLEEGGNVTLSTVQKILAQLPGLELKVHDENRSPESPDAAAMREAVQALVTAAQRVLQVLDGQPAPRLDHGPVGATRYEEDGMQVSPEQLRRLLAMIDEIKAGKNKPKREH